MSPSFGDEVIDFPCLILTEVYLPTSCLNCIYDYASILQSLCNTSDSPCMHVLLMNKACFHPRIFSFE